METKHNSTRRNKTNLRKGMILYFVDTYRYSYTHPVLPATIERIRTTPDYIVCKMSYIWNFATGPEKVFRPALFKNESGTPAVDITNIFFADRQYATDVRDWRVEQWECCDKHGVVLPKKVSPYS